jgi:competence protein ComEC
MGSLVILAQLIGRRSAGINILLMTAAVMCLFNPYLPWDVSFQLSFLATLGLVLFAEPLTSGVSAWIEKRISNPALQKTAKGLVDIFLLTIAAQAMTLPVLAYHFRSISLSAIIANPLVLPVQPALMVLGLTAVMLGIVWLPLGGIFGWAASLLAGYTNSMVTFLSKIPGTLSFPQISLGVVIAGYALLFGWLWFYPRSPRRMIQGTLVTGLVLASFGVWTTGLRISDDRLHIRILSNPDHPALIMQTPKGGWLMLNGLANTMEFQNAVQQYLPSLNRHLDALVITNLDSVTVSSIHDAVADFPVAMILWVLEGQGNSETRWLESDLRQLGTSSQMMNTGDFFELDGVTIQAVEISDTARSLLIRYGKFELAIPDGIPAKDLSEIVPSTSTLLLTQAQSLDPDLVSWTSDHPLFTISTGAPHSDGRNGRQSPRANPST